MSKPRPMTREEMRNAFLQHIRDMVEYWDLHAPHGSRKERLEGLAFSILVALDGESMALPAFNLIAAPHPDDAAVCRSQGENWWTARSINNDAELHSLLLHPGE